MCEGRRLEVSDPPNSRVRFFSAGRSAGMNTSPGHWFAYTAGCYPKCLCFL